MRLTCLASLFLSAQRFIIYLNSLYLFSILTQFAFTLLKRALIKFFISAARSKIILIYQSWQEHHFRHFMRVKRYYWRKGLGSFISVLALDQDSSHLSCQNCYKIFSCLTTQLRSLSQRMFNNPLITNHNVSSIQSSCIQSF